MQKEMERRAERPASRAANPHSSKKPIAAAAVIFIIIVLVLIPCILAATSNTIYPRTTVAGINVGGMTTAQAQDVLAQELPSAYEDETLSITVDRSSAGVQGDEASAVFELPLSDVSVTADAEQSARNAYENGRSGNFFTSGIAYARSLLLGSQAAAQMTVDTSSLQDEITKIATQADIPITECAWRIDGETLVVTKPKSGYVIDQDALLQSVEEAINEHDLKGISCELTESAPVSVTMEDIYNDAHREATNAYYDKTEGTVKDGDVGVDFDPAAAQAQMDEAEPGTEFSIPITVTEPKISKEEMTENLFRDKLGSCTTSVGGTSNRKHNVGLAAQSCNGVILNPGETFSYNETLGERTAANGYRSAAAYVGGKTVLEYGGGICQVSSTLYLAVLRSNLEIVNRTNHMFYPGYIPYGMDATVSWGGPDFKFKNNTDYPIKIVATYSGGKSTCTIYGTNTTGNTVKMEYKVLSTTPYKTVTQEDSSLAPGTSKEAQNGYTGYKVVTYRCVYDKNGNLISRNQEATSTYRSRDRIVLVGPEKQTTTPSTPEDGSGTNSGSTETDSGSNTGTPSSGDSAGETTQTPAGTENTAKPDAVTGSTYETPRS